MTAFDLLVRGGRCVLSGGVRETDLGLRDGRIVSQSTAPDPQYDPHESLGAPT